MKMNFNNDIHTPIEAQNSRHITKQNLLKIREIYQFCKNAQQNQQIRHIVNTKFAQIVEQAEEQIKSFAEGKIQIDDDALDLMKEYIEEFGRNYYKRDGQMRYEYSPEATKAKIMLKQRRYQTARQFQTEAPETFNPNALFRGTADEFVLPDNETVKADTTEAAAAVQPEAMLTIQETEPCIRAEENPAEFTPADFSTETVKTPVQDPGENMATAAISLSQTQIVLPVQTAKEQFRPVSKNSPKKKSSLSIFSRVKEFCGDTAKAFRRNFKRYGVAAAALFSSTGIFNGYPMNNNRADKSILNIKTMTLPETMPERTADLTASFTQPAGENKNCMADIDYRPADFTFFSSSLEQTVAHALARQDSLAAAESNITLADLPYQEIEFSAEDLAAIVPSETALKLAEDAEKVAAQMDCEGYCFRGAKKAFRQAGLGEMYGRSAYMAKRQLDNNPHFIRINSSVKNNTVVPDGGVGVYGRSAAHPHGHIGIFSGNKDCSSKIRRPMTSTGNYSSFNLYLPADTKVPSSILKKIEQIMVLKKDFKEKPQPKLVSPFLLAIHNFNTKS